MKKALSIVALIVLIGTDFLNPISYAIEQEEVIFGIEENTGLENENHAENIGEINDGDVEEEKEVVEEVEDIEEITEEADEGVEDEDGGDWEDYVEEENKELEENEREEKLEENTGLFTSELSEDGDVEKAIVEKGNDEEAEEMDAVDNGDDLDGGDGLIEKNKELDGEKNIEKLEFEGGLEVYNQEKEKLEIKDIVENKVKAVKGTLSKENGVTYVFADDVTFDGTNYINTDLKLFDSSFGQKDFDISFNVDNITYIAGQNSNRNNIMHIIKEKGDTYQGFDLRLENDASIYTGQIKVGSNKDFLVIDNPTTEPSSFSFWTKNNVLYYDNNGVDVPSLDFSSVELFDYPLMFGAALDGSKRPYRYMNGKLSDIGVYVAYDNGDEITLPNPVRSNKIFGGVVYR